MTEGNETITLHTESWDRITGILRLEAERTGNPTPETIANTIDAQRADEATESPPDAIGLMGLPGAGKSYVAEKLEAVYDTESISMGDAIRRHYCKETYGQFPDEMDKDGYVASSESLAEFAAETRDEDATTIPHWTCDMAEDLDADPVIIDGVRSVTDYEVLNERFDRFYLMRVRAPFETRLERITERGREGEDAFDRVDLAERDQHEMLALGQGALLDEVGPDLTLTNDRGEAALRRNLATLIHENLPFDVVDEEPILPVVGRALGRRGPGIEMEVQASEP